MIELIEWEDNTVTIDNVGERAREIRLKNDMTLWGVALDANVSITTVDKFEKGSNATLYTMFSVLDALGQEVVIREKRS